MRGTLHLLPSKEFPIWAAALGTSRRYLRSAAWQKHFGVTMEELEQLTAAIGQALDGRVMAREELAREVGRVLGSAALGAKLAQGSWGTILKPAAFSGRLCFGPSLGQRVQYTHPGSWLKHSNRQSVDADTATRTIVRRFLAAYGPARYQDLAKWWGGGMAAVRQWMRALGEEVEQVEIAGEKAWMLAADVREMRELPAFRSARLLPGFDHYVVAASRYAEQLLPGVPRVRVYRPQGWVSPVLLVNGMMQGVWRHEIKGSRVEMVIEPFVKQPSWVRRAACEEAERLASFLGGALRLEWKKNR
jgi:hypothetical protein